MHRFAIMAGAALCLSACASTYVGKPYERAEVRIHDIALLSDAIPDHATSFQVASVGSNFGLVGALVDAGIQKSRENDVNNSLTRAGFNARAKLEARLVSDLATDGYQVKPLSEAPRAKREFLTAYPKADGADAYLDVVVENYGYLSAGAGKPFRPTVTAQVRLVSAKDPTKTLMENKIAYNTMTPRAGAITIAPNAQYSFRNRADLVSDPKRLAGGIEDALDQVADTAAKLLN